MASKRKSDADLLDEAKRRFKAASEAEAKQRKREQDDLRFQVPEYQWDDDAKRQRMGEMVAGVPVPGRPILSISLLDQPIQLVQNQERAAHLGINIHPIDEKATDDTAEVIQGMYRQIERESQAGLARSWAFDRASKCGQGVYRVNTTYDDTGGHPFDQKITIERILYQDSVKWDPAARLPDKSDASYAFQIQWMSVEDFEAQYPETKLERAEGLDFAELVRQDPDWIKADGEAKAVLVADYWYKDYEEETYVALTDGTAVQEEELTEADRKKIDESVPKRTKKVTQIYFCKVTAGDVLEKQEWNGHYIPLIPVLGKELQPFDNDRRYTGMIGPAKDSQRLFNYAVSTAVEVAALEPKAPFIGAKGTFEGYESNWQQANIRNFPYLEYNPVIHQGVAQPPPTRTPIDASKLAVSLQLMQQAKDGVQNTTQTFDPSLGALPTKDRSGKAIQALQNQSDAGNSHYLHNLADISMAYEAKVVLDLIPTIYDRPGRMVRTLDDEDNSDTVMLNQEHIINPKTKRPISVVPNVPLPPAGTNPDSGPAEIKNYDLRKGTYGVEVTVGKSWQTRLEQGSEEIGQILQAQPNLMPIIGPLYFKFRDFPGAKEIAELLKKIREKQFPGLDDDGTGMPTPEAAQAQIQAKDQQIKELQQQLQQAIMEVKTDQAKQQATIQKTQIETQSRERIAMEANTVKLLIEKLDNLQKMVDSALLRGHEKEAQRFDAAHEVAMAGADHVSQASLAAAQAVPPFTAANPQGLGSEEGI